MASRRTAPSATTPESSGDGLGTLLDETVDLLLGSLATLRSQPDPDPSRLAADSARLTAAVTQLVRARHLHHGAAAPDPSAASAIFAAVLAELDAEAE